MIERLKDAAWFVKASWNFIGCDSGSGRWAARARFFATIVPTTITYWRKRTPDFAVSN